MGSIGIRLREERERLGLSQTEMAERCGSTRKSQFNYESDARRPDADYLSALTAVGADVLYILTGQRVVQPAPTLTPRKAALLDNYEHADEAGKKIIEGAADLAAKSGTNKRGKAA